MTRFGPASLVCALSGIVLLALAVALARAQVPVAVRAVCAVLALACAVASLVTGMKGRGAWTGKVGIVLGIPVSFVALVFTALSCIWLTQ